jgi:hypothetical protein
MFSIFRHHDYTTVGWLKSVLDAEGIPAHVKNYASSVGITEIPIPEFYPDLCVLNEEDVSRAVEILRPYVEKDPTAKPLPDWTCPKCSESVPGNIGSCWNCATPAPTP